MDVLYPQLEEIDGAMYRVNSTDYAGSRRHGPYVEDEAEFTDDERYEECYDTTDEIFKGMPIIEEIPQSKMSYHRFRTQFHIPKALHGFLIGAKGQTRQRLEYETRTKMLIPKKDEEGDIVVSGSKEKHIREMYFRILTLSSSSRKKLSFTHFISIPMNASNIRERFEKFKNQVMECCGGEQEIIQNELFTIPEKLHLTFTVFTLLDDHEREVTSRRLDECLENVIEPILKNEAIAVQVRGIDIMNDDPTRVKVLYARVESENNILQKLADEVTAYFKRGGLTTDKFERDHVKLHLTLMNTRYLENEIEEPTRQKNKRRFTFDASKILQNFQDFDFGVTLVNTLHLSQMGAYSEDGFYLSSNRIKWGENVL